MSAYWPLIVAGIADGSVIAIAAMGLVLSYKVSGIFNFAQGAIGALAAGVFYQLYVDFKVPVIPGMLVTLIVVGGGFGLVMAYVAKLVASASTTMKIVSTVGIMVSIQALFNLRFGGLTRTFPSFLPGGTFLVGGVSVGYEQVIVVIVGLGCAVSMTWFLRRTMLGRGMRAIVDDPQLVALVGISPSSVRRWAWVIGTTFAGISGVLIVPELGLDSTTLGLLVLSSFGAAAIGRFSSLPLTYIGALGIEIAVDVSTKIAASNSSLQSLPTALPFVILFVVLLLSPKRWLVEVGESLQQRVIAVPRHSRAVGLLKIAPALVLIAIVPFVFEAHLLAWTNGMIFLTLMLSLSLLVRLSNQISLCQLSFAAVGAIVSYKLESAGWSWTLAALAGGVVAIPVGAVVAIPAARLSGIYLGIATLAFGMVLQMLFYQTNLMFGSEPIPLFTPRPGFAQSNHAFYFLCAGIGLLAYGLVRLIERARLGQFLRCKADSPIALQALGVNIALLPLLAFCVAAFLAGVAGSLVGPAVSVVGSASFQVMPTSLLLLALLVLGGRNPRIGTFGAALGGAIGLVVIPDYITNYKLLQGLDLFFGVATVEAAVASTKSLAPRRAMRLPGWIPSPLRALGTSAQGETPQQDEDLARPVAIEHAGGERVA